mmetsp:Transcript_9197/g.11876  ORF Transcript_9197/g.11876 Transcript_9197/m.11876 type:complete len:185 (+) Transcript_9197:178-732(+)|eukprot:CAMPEP_0116073512 /NCGR_PEP_ID=MMETSP0322-20121206/15282_1 /TAXON_ID=163516 /ORGANISM="Leptocylindrus danicus var. apora, Strain B651" /LENGTH=184 /DNA_ID=CAMNT_0003562791 /DNA_START=152 /DNA_END=706 /DNA_ORIENTATION=-
MKLVLYSVVFAILCALIEALVPIASERNTNRRTFFKSAGASFGAALTGEVLFSPSQALADSSVDAMISDMEKSKEIISRIPDLLKAEKWDEARTLLKTPPVNFLWNMGDNQNTLLRVAKATGNFDLIEVKDELSLSLQMCDQYTYDNVFVYFQPGNGKVHVKEPLDLAEKANKQISEAIEIAKQ